MNNSLTSKADSDSNPAREQACTPFLRSVYLRAYPFNLDLLLSAAPVESHVGAVVDSPNACVTLALPLGIFEHVRLLPFSEVILLPH